MLYSFYRERHGVGHYVLVSKDMCLVVDGLVGTIIRTFPLKQLRKDAFALLKPATLYSCLVDVNNKSVRVSRFTSNGQAEAQPISLASFGKKDLEWCQLPEFRFKFTISIPLHDRVFKQVVYVMEGA